MKKIKTLHMILKQTHSDKILVSYLAFVFVAAFVILLTEPEIHRYSDALWYLYAVISTAGFGDIVVHTFFAKIVSVVVTIYSLIVIAVITGVIVNFHTTILELSRRDTLTAFLDKLERLPELSPEELSELSEKVHSYRLLHK